MKARIVYLTMALVLVFSLAAAIVPVVGPGISPVQAANTVLDGRTWFYYNDPLPEGDGYNPLQRLTYTGIVLFFGPLVVLTGLAMSPQWDAWFPWYVDLFGGRQFARTWHFLLMAGLVAFTAAHLVLVAMAGWPTFWSMIAGGPRPKPEAAHE